MFGVPMGSPVSVVIANLVMESVENSALLSFPNPPRFWRRFVDDTFVIINNDKIDDFFEHINQVEDSINFTMEREVENCLPFLDVLVTKLADGSLQTKVHRKPTQTDRYLNFNSHHPLQHKRSVVKTLLARAASHVTTEADRELEIQRVCESLAKNDYPNWFLKQCMSTENTGTENETTPNGIVVLPFCPNLSYTLKRILNDYGIKVCFKPYTTIKNVLDKSKDKINPLKRKGAIYEIPCADCQQVYVGETGRSFNTRCKEHKRDVKNELMGKLDGENRNTNCTALVKHVQKSNHDIDWNNCKILHFETNFVKRRFLESYFIHQNGQCVNEKENSYFPAIYDDFE